MAAPLDERLLPLAIMMIVTGSVLVMPFILLRNGKFKLKKDIIFIVFWFQSWIYLCFFPLLNCMFPNSDFAFPPHLADLRVIRFTVEEVYLYAFIQLLLLILFYFPMLYFYKNKLRKFSDLSQRTDAVFNPSSSGRKIHFNKLRNIDNHKQFTSFNRLFILCLFYSIFGILYSIVAIKGGLLSGYAVNVDIFVTMNLVDRFIWRIYNISATFILVVLLLAYFERQWSSRFKTVLFVVAIAPGVIIEFISHLISSRGAMLFSAVSVFIVLYIRGHITHSKRRLTVILVLMGILLIYSFKIIPNLRGIVLSPVVTSDDIKETLNPFSSKVDRLTTDAGFRFDGVELMVLATPYLLKQGLVPFSWYAITFINPILPLFPDIERKLKIDDDVTDFKKRYLEIYTPAITPDYLAVSFTELFMVMGPLGYLIAGIFYGIIFKWINRLIRKNSNLMIGGFYIMFQVLIFELPLSTVITGWVRCLPVLLIILLFNPWSKFTNNRFVFNTTKVVSLNNT